MGGFITTIVFDIIIILEKRFVHPRKSHQGGEWKQNWPLSIFHDKNEISKC